MAKKLKFMRMKATVKLDPIFKQWVVIVPTKDLSWRAHSMTYFKEWNDAIKFALNVFVGKITERT